MTVHRTSNPSVLNHCITQRAWSGFHNKWCSAKLLCSYMSHVAYVPCCICPMLHMSHVAYVSCCICTMLHMSHVAYVSKICNCRLSLFWPNLTLCAKALLEPFQDNCYLMYPRVDSIPLKEGRPLRLAYAVRSHADSPPFVLKLVN